MSPIPSLMSRRLNPFGTNQTSKDDKIQDILSKLHKLEAFHTIVAWLAQIQSQSPKFAIPGERASSPEMKILNAFATALVVNHEVVAVVAEPQSYREPIAPLSVLATLQHPTAIDGVSPPLPPKNQPTESTTGSWFSELIKYAAIPNTRRDNKSDAVTKPSLSDATIPGYITFGDHGEMAWQSVIQHS